MGSAERERSLVPSSIVRRIVRESGVADLLEVLAERLSPTDLQSLLLEVYRRRAARRRPSGVLDDFAQNRFVAPSRASPQALLELDRLAFSLAAPPFEAVELSPVCPLGTNSAVAAVSQNVAVATVRTTEVVSDSTNVLALECALRRRALRRFRAVAGQRVQLCASHRVLRAQRYHQPSALAHFRLFALCSAGRDEGGNRFERESLAEHLRFYLRLLAAWRESSHPVGGLRVALTSLAEPPAAEPLLEEVMAVLAGEFPDAHFGVDAERTSGRGYYDRLCFHVYASDAAGDEYELADGGFTTWTQALLGDRKERLLISGIGSERVCGVFA